MANTGDRPIQVGSHFHFFEANKALRFARARAFGMRLNVPAGTAVRFEPGDEKKVDARRTRRAREVYGLNGLTEGPVEAKRPRRGARARPRAGLRGRAVTLRIPRRQYASLYGPTAGDRVRLADTGLLLEVERDLTVPGEEAKFGGGKVLRDGMGQSARATRADGVLDLVITNAVVLDHWGVVKADVGVRDGRIVALGKAGNPDIMDGVTPGHGGGLEHRGDRGRRAHRHRRRHRQPHPLHLPAAGVRGDLGRRHDPDRRRNRSRDGHERHHLHAWRVQHRTACWKRPRACP